MLKIEGELGDAKIKYQRDPGSEKRQCEKQHNSKSVMALVHSMESTLFAVGW